MATSYPGTIDTFTNPSGTQFLSSPDHSLQHSDANDAIETIETVLGTTSGTSVLLRLSVGKFAAPTVGGTLTTTTISSGTISGVLIGTSAVQGGTIANVLIGTSSIVGGTAGAVTLGTPIMDFFTTSGTTVATKANRGLAPTVGTLADSPGGTITANAPSAQIFEITLGTTVGTRTIGTPTNPVDGMGISYRIKQNAANTGTIVWGSAFLQNVNGTIALGTSNSWNYYGYRYRAAGTIWDSQGNSTGIV